MRAATLLLSSFLLAGCAMNSQFEPPVVDMRGREQAFATDQGECIDRARAAAANSVMTVGAPVTECMRAKGYPIIAPKS